jgi:acyl carrier protein
MSAHAAILRHIEAVAAEQTRRLPPLIDDLPLRDSGLDSLCFAILVARLEDDLAVDPFQDAEDYDFPETLGDFIAFYDRALAVG